MNRKLSLITLGISLSSMLVLVGAMVVSQPKYTLKNIVGKQSSLGDVIIYSQDQTGIYSSNSIMLSKDEYKFSKNIKQNPETYKYVNGINENRDMFKGYIYDTDFIYSDENSIGYMDYVIDNYGEFDITLSTTIHEKNLKTDEIEEFQINISNNLKSENNINHKELITKYNNEVYIALTTIHEKNLKTDEIEEFQINISNNLKSENNINHKELITKYNNEVYIALLGTQQNTPDRKKGEKDELEDFVEISKVDFNNGEAKIVNKVNLKIDDDSKYRIIYHNPFTIENKIYFFLEKQDKLENSYYLAYYDIHKNKFDYIDNKITLEYPLDTYQINIEGTKLNLLTSISNKNNVDLNLFTFDLESKEIIINNEEYSINKLNNQTDVYSFRVIDNKIYLLVDSCKTYNSDVRRDMREFAKNIVVLDKSSKTTLYIGEYRQGDEFTSNSYILKSDEL